jgi:hypothetical protein
MTGSKSMDQRGRADGNGCGYWPVASGVGPAALQSTRRKHLWLRLFPFRGDYAGRNRQRPVEPGGQSRGRQPDFGHY